MAVSKLRSRKGASLIVALFLLIICSTVGSIILTAATANVGRISERAEYDRKYYKVISAARLFADEIAKSDITLTVELFDGAAVMNAFDSATDSQLSRILRSDICRIYKGPDSALDAAIAEGYLRETFSHIGRDEKYSKSDTTAFVVSVRDDGENSSALSTVYGRLMLEAARGGVDAVLDPGLDSVTHNITAVFYSDEDTDNQIPENAYVVKLVCPADAASVQTDPSLGTMSIAFKWTRENMRIEQVRGVG